MRCSFKKPAFDKEAAALVLSIFAAVVVIWSFTGNMPPAKNPYNSYSLQAERWLMGHLDLGKNYEHLEIAEFNGRYYISFPPFPSMLLIPFVAVFGANTPDGIISAVIAVFGAVYALKIARCFGKTGREALFWSLFVTLGGNFVFVMSQGWVWFFAQTLAFSLILSSIYYALKKKGALSCFLWACAVGCRPFSFIYLPVLIYLASDWDKRGLSWLLSVLKSLAPAAVMGAIYMLLNYLRFHNLFEFGHNYLPEFVETEYGQFSPMYMAENIKNLFRLPEISTGYLAYPKFNGFAFYIASPIFITYAIYFTRSKKSGTDILISLLLIINLLLLTAHKTMGGWQFGNRYTIDLLPFLYLGLMRLVKDKAFSPLNIPLFVLGAALNFCGTVALMGKII